MKAAFVVARYGTEINGGAELHCRMVAERLKNEWDIDVLTTCALDYIHWSNYFECGTTKINGVKTRRFNVDYERPINTFNSFYNTLISLHLLKSNADIPLNNTKHIDRLFSAEPSDCQSILPQKLSNAATDFIKPLENLWLKLQGPNSSQMLRYIQDHRDDYDVFIFFSANYCTTYFGLQLVAEKSILVPTMHREACITFDLYQDLFKLPQSILYNTFEEMRLAHQIFPQTRQIESDIVGVGVDTNILNTGPSSPNLEKFGIKGPFILYLGRIEESKGCLDLCHFFVNFNNKIGGKLTLVFAGKQVCELPNRDDVIHVGFVSDQDKYQLIQEALALCIPSLFESLSMVLLEAWSLGTPTLVNGHCQVLKSHINRGRGGFCYHNEESFDKYLRLILEHPSLRPILGQQGKKYVSQNYQWPNILRKYKDSATRVATRVPN